MEATKLESEFANYWSKLTIVQKESILQVVKNFVYANDASEGIIPEEQWEKILQEREAHYQGSKSYTWEEVKEMARNKEKRHGLSS